MSAPLHEKMAAIARSVEQNQFRYTVHGASQRIARRLSRTDIEEAIRSGEIIEDYPDDHYGPCCLILGSTRSGKSLHLVCSYRSVVDIITVYEPDPLEWEPDGRTRKQGGT